MIKWLHITLVTLSAGFLALIILLIIKRCFCSKTRKKFIVSDTEKGQSLQNGISRLHQVSPHHNNHGPDHEDGSKRTNHNHFRSAVFNWSDHPSLVTDAVENGWPRFAFTVLMSSPSVKSARARLGPCRGDPGNDANVEIGWEVCEGSSDYMQKIRLNPGLKISSKLIGKPATVIRTGLPLPGPHLGSLSFPQEAYFEIMILENNTCDVKVDKKGKLEGEKIKLITDDFNAKNNEEGSITRKIDEVKNGRRNEGALVSIGLTRGGPLELKIPGSYSGSIGFNSTGSVYLDGTKLVFDSGQKDEWGKSDKVIGCGYNPSQKKVFFTIDSLLVHEIHCQTEDFGFPLYPTLASNSDTMALVNLGQSPFKYMPANMQRTCNPCFVANSPALGYDDSKELFSMGRIDAQWRLQRRSNNNTVNSLKALEYDQESEGDLFEIVLDSTGRSPSGRSPYSTTPSQMYQ